MKKTKNALGIKGKLTQYGDKEFSLFIRKSFLRSAGYSDDALNKPIVGICAAQSDYNTCHGNINSLIESVKRGILSAGGLPMLFPTISLGEINCYPTSLVYRNLMSMDVEEMIGAQPMDGCILIGGCDKTVPAQLMGATSANILTAQLVTGPMSTDNFKGERLGACTDCRSNWMKYRSGLINKNEITEIEKHLATTHGTCAVMGTASTMACISEILGLMLPGSATIPSTHSDRLRISEQTAYSLTSLIINKKGIFPKKLINQKSIENAMVVIQAIGGSTNALIHLAAIAGRNKIPLDYKKFNAIAKKIPVLINLKPSGDFYMQDFHAAGGLLALLKELKKYLHLDSKFFNEKNLGFYLKKKINYIDNKVIKSIKRPLYSDGGLIYLYGNIAPRGALLKISAGSKKFFEVKAKAFVFDSIEEMSKKIDRQDLDVNENDILVLKNIGPKSPTGMPESGYIPIPKKLAKKGVKDMIRISDGRMSGSAFGTVVLHVSPDAASFGPFAIIETGDFIKLSVKNRKIELCLSDLEISKRLKKLKVPKKKIERGYQKLYHEHVLQADLGCDFDFLIGK